MRRTDFPVSADGRAGGAHKCFYCHAPVGQQHNAGCVQRTRTVVIRATVELLVEEPEDHDVSLIEFGYNEGSWCASNLVRLIEEQDARTGCICDLSTFEFVRDATPEDEKRYKYPGWKQG